MDLFQTPNINVMGVSFTPISFVESILWAVNYSEKLINFSL
jgi:hypothetical protein